MKKMNFFLVKLLIIWITFHLVELVDSRDAPPIIIPDQGTVLGTYMKMYRIQNIIAYLGIPYAQPPKFERRFQPPVVDNIPFWDGVRNATHFQADCMQNPERKTIKRHDELFSKVVKASSPTTNNEDMPRRYDEDCLYLNIFIPDAPAPMEGYAVIVWLHSGDFMSGSAQDIDPFQIVFKQKVMVITLNYRLGIFGFLTSLDGESPGNFGLMDQAAALLWIRRNIKLFGGNDQSITLMGHGSGAISVGLHLTSGEWSDGLFHKAIIMSGSSLADTIVKEPILYNQVLNTFPNVFGCFRRPTSLLLQCLRNVNAQTLAEYASAIEWGPIIDEGLSNTTTPFIPDSPRMLVERGVLRQVPVLMGYTDMEEVLDVLMDEMMTSGITSEMYETLISEILMNELTQLESNDSCGGNMQIVTDAVGYAYKPFPPITDPLALRKMFIDYNTERKYIAPTLQLAAHMSKHAPTYVYRFDIKAQTQSARFGIAEWIGVPHNYDLIFVWGMPYWSKPDAMSPWDTADKRVSDIIMTLWMNFVKYTNPSKIGVYINWEKFTVSEQKILVIDRTFNMSDDHTINYRAVQFWNDYYPRVVMHAIQCCNSTNAAISLQKISQSFNFLITLCYAILLALLFFQTTGKFST